MRALFAVAVAVAVAVVVCGCQPPRSDVSTGTDLPYPTCPGGAPGAGEVIASGHLRSGPISREADVVERYELRRRDCLHVMTSHQEWGLAIMDVEVVYDLQWKPLRAWRRTAIPGTEDGQVDIRRYELRTPEVGMKRLMAEGTVRRYVVRGQSPDVVIAPGRGMLVPWIRRERLAVGGLARRRVLDIREDIEKIIDGALRRDPPHRTAELGEVRVYTFYGRESVFADEHDAVVGDLAGMRPSSVLSTPAPPALPTYGTLDPVHTP